ncbi:MAG: class I tRNA ligase family protein [Planctomycetota bacterium]
MPDAPTTSDTEQTTPFRYDARLAERLELACQARWEESAPFRALNPGDEGFDPDAPKFYALDMFPYPSAAGLHVGHPLGYIATDILSRYKRMRGFNVLHPMGWDAFGLPAEQYAIKTGVHPAKTTGEAIDNFRRQLKRFGFSYDWSREVSTIDPGYYKWTQWIWLQMYTSYFDEHAGKARPIADLVADLEGDVARPGAKGNVLRAEDKEWGGARAWAKLSAQERRGFLDNLRLAYLGEQTVNWCPKLGTVLANEEVIDGKSERGSHPVVRRPLKQWMFRITAFADRLLEGLDSVDWPESTRTMQREWIGRSEGAHADFACGKRRIRIYTTRPDTLYGATYMVLAPEHPLVDELAADEYGGTAPDAWKAQGFPGARELVAAGAKPPEIIAAYRTHVASRSDVDRQEGKEKSGVFIGAYAINPVNDERIPVFIADYVMMGYGTGAIMAVPAHDTRDFEFAKVFSLPIKDVVYPRTLLAMKHFFGHVTEGEARSERWFWLLADLLGIVTTDNIGPDGFAAALEEARTTRQSVMDVPAPAGEEGSVGERRGVIRMQWMEAIESMGFATFQDGRALFEEARVHAHLGEAYTADGFAVNSPGIDGMRLAESKPAATALLESKKLGEHTVQFRLRDWLFSRQRYWGEPFPVVFDEEGNHYPVANDRLPVELPPLEDYTPAESDDPQPLLGKATGWVRTTAGAAGVTELPPETVVTRETNTMPGWAGSCWYYLRYCDPHNHTRFVGEEAERYWTGSGAGGVDLYIGGAEHAVLHLLYARFWHMALHDLGHLSTPEPFRKLFHQGLITSHAYQRVDKTLVPIDEVEETPTGFVETTTRDPVVQTIAKMSKSLRNVVNPDEVIASYGADTMRLYEMYMGPLDQSKPWNTEDITGMHRFLQRAWRLVVDERTGELSLRDDADDSTEKQLHRTIAKVGDDVERLAFNTAIASMIEFVNHASKAGGLTRDQTERFARILSPFVPHVAEALWERLGVVGELARAPWPDHDPAMLVDDEVEVPVQIMGKVRARITVPAGLDRQGLEEAALADGRVRQLIEGKTVRKVIVVPGKLVNIVAN